MHFTDLSPTAGEPMDLVLLAVKEATRGACHLADVAGRLGAPEEATRESLEASLRASRSLFALEDAMLRQQEGMGPVCEALASLQVAEEAVRAARLAIETRVSRTLQPAAPPGPVPRP